MTYLDKENAIKKSQELINKFGKQSALVAVQVILDHKCGYWAYDGVSCEEIMIDAEYWEEVKKGIEK